LKIKFLGQAGISIKTKTSHLVCDPWFSDTGGFLARWHQFPPNEIIPKEYLHNCDYLYISHEHHDHFDREFLNSFPKDITILIANFQTKEFRDEFKSMGFSKIIEINDWQKIKLSVDLEVMLVSDPGKYKEDSSLLILSDGFKILNKNDCYHSKDYMEKFASIGIDLLFTQFSGAIWYPMIYDYDEETKKKSTKKVRTRLNEYFIDVVNSIKPKYVIPSAGPPCFLEDDCFQFNFHENGIFPDQQDIIPEIDGKLFSKYNMMQPDDNIILNSTSGINFENKHTFDFSNKESLLLDYQKKRLPVIKKYLNQIPVPKHDMYQNFSNFFNDIFNYSSYFTSKVEQLVEFEITGNFGGNWQIDFNEKHPKIYDHTIKEPNYKFTLDSKYMNLILNEQINWEDFLLSLRINISRTPDVYDGSLFALLQYGRSPLLIQRAENYELRSKSPTTINVQDNTKMYKIQKFCPHLGEDLKNATLKNGILVCPRHQWNFDLNSCGKCIAGGNKDLPIYEITDLDEAENTGMA
jgi:UDP-MurNAc hydroxylase